MMKVRKAEWSDLDTIMEIYQGARQFMVVQGNPSQWSEGYPTRALIEGDIEIGQSGGRRFCLDAGTGSDL